MNILFLISSNGKGAGGHYNSLFQISSEIGKKHEAKIILLGNGDSPIIKNSPHFSSQIRVGKNIFEIKKLKNHLSKFFEEFKPDLIHCFDTDSLNRILLANPIKKSIPIVLNKCGGGNPLRGNYQHADAIVVFSMENKNWFLDNRRYKNEDIFFIPNRVKRLELLAKHKQVESASENKLSFLRVSRLGGAYEHTLIQTFNLLDKVSLTIPVELFIVGKVQNQDRFLVIQEKAKKKKYEVKFITDDRAYKGSDFLYLADLVIGTGRSFMEATSLGIPTLTPSCNTEFPVLVDKDNINTFLRTNFSERNVASLGSDIGTLLKIEKLYHNKSYRRELELDTRNFFVEYFGTDKILEKYEEVYHFLVEKETKKRKLIWKNLPYLIKYLLSK